MKKKENKMKERERRSSNLLNFIAPIGLILIVAMAIMTIYKTQIKGKEDFINKVNGSYSELCEKISISKGYQYNKVTFTDVFPEKIAVFCTMSHTENSSDGITEEIFKLNGLKLNKNK